jgi:hypothetical protein
MKASSWQQLLRVCELGHLQRSPLCGQDRRQTGAAQSRASCPQLRHWTWVGQWAAGVAARPLVSRRSSRWCASRGVLCGYSRHPSQVALWW